MDHVHHGQVEDIATNLVVVVDGRNLPDLPFRLLVIDIQNFSEELQDLEIAKANDMNTDQIRCKEGEVLFVLVEIPDLVRVDFADERWCDGEIAHHRIKGVLERIGLAHDLTELTIADMADPRDRQSFNCPAFSMSQSISVALLMLPKVTPSTAMM